MAPLHGKDSIGETMNRLHEKGYISNPKSKAKSVGVTAEGRRKAEELFIKYCV